MDLHDYLGQGGALVGLLDPFWEPKSYVTAEQFRRFCSPTVLLARLRQNILKTSDAFEVETEIAHYGPSPINNARPVWKIADPAGNVVAQGKWPAKDIPIGKNTDWERRSWICRNCRRRKSTNSLSDCRALQFENDWRFWLYPAKIDTKTPSDILLTSDWKVAATRLAAGGKVLFNPPLSILDNTSPPLNDVPVFWNRLMNPKLEAMLGLLINPKHPALARFPTEAILQLGMD